VTDVTTTAPADEPEVDETETERATPLWQRLVSGSSAPIGLILVALIVVFSLIDSSAFLDIASARKNLKRRLVERQPILHVGDAERFAQASWAGAQQTFVANAATPTHGRETLRRRERADEHGTRHARRLAHEIEAPMNTVRAVDIGVAGRAEHDHIALGAAAEGMGRRVGLMIGLNLDDDAADSLEQQGRADEIGSDDVYAAGKKTSVE